MNSLSQHVQTLKLAELLKEDWMSVADWGEAKVNEALRLLRWPQTGGLPSCPQCGCQHYRIHRRDSAYTCVECVAQFTIRTGTLFSRSKLSDIQMLRLVFASQVYGSLPAYQICDAIGVMRNHGTKWLERIGETFEGKLTFPRFYSKPIRTFRRTPQQNMAPKIPRKQAMARYLLVKENRKKRISEVVADFFDYDTRFAERTYRDLMSQPMARLQQIAEGKDPIEEAQEEILKYQNWNFKHSVLEDPLLEHEIPYNPSFADSFNPCPRSVESGHQPSRPPLALSDVLPF